MSCEKKQLQEDLLQAIKKQDLLAVEKYIQTGADVNDTTKGYTPLTLALRKSSDEVVQLLLDNNANPDQKTKQGVTPLRMACKDNNTQKVLSLLRANADVNQTSKKRKPIIQAINEGKQAIVQLLLQHNADLSPDCSGDSALIIAIKKQNNQIVQLLLTNPHVDVNQQVGRITPLMLALELDYTQLAQLLMQHNANVNQQIDGITLLAHFIKKQQVPAVELLLASGADPYLESNEQTALEIADKILNKLKKQNEQIQSLESNNKKIIALKKIITLIEDAIQERQKGTAAALKEIGLDPDTANLIGKF